MVVYSHDCVGLFGETAPAANIHNIGLLGLRINATRRMSPTGSVYTGGLVGLNEGDITNSYVFGQISTKQAQGPYNFGGLVGYFTGGSIINSYANTNIATNTHTSDSGGVGGLVGVCVACTGAGPCTIQNSYALGSLTSPRTGTRASGGGLLGRAIGGTLSIVNSYANIMMSPSAKFRNGAGGLVGSIGSATLTVTGSYWDRETTEQNTSAGGATRLTSAQMQATDGTYPQSLGAGFRLTAGSYPKIYKCEDNTCASFTDEILPWQYVDVDSALIRELFP